MSPFLNLYLSVYDSFQSFDWSLVEYDRFTVNPAYARISRISRTSAVFYILSHFHFASFKSIFLVLWFLFKFRGRSSNINWLHTWSAITVEIGLIWEQTRELVLVPALKLVVILCLAMTVLIFIENLYMGIVVVFVKLLGRKPEKVYKWEAMKDDVELGSSSYPMVLVQIPMHNEKEVCQLSIEAACRLSWPSDRIVIQVLDDSTDPSAKELVKTECQRWAVEGINIKCEIRDNRNGYKAGAMTEGLEHSYTQQCDYLAIFDADFQPDPDFLLRTIPFLLHNSELALVQGRWKYVNADECLLTRIQEISHNYHFTVEQEAGSSTVAFFGFNGTAGVWRMSALKEAGGWKDRTTTEDMDLSVRVSLNGWKFVYVDDLEVKSELPSTLSAYRNQQRRWTCGLANLFRKMAIEIIRNKRISWRKKFHLIYDLFLVRKILTPLVTFIFYCIVLPATVIFPEVEVPKWGSSYLPSSCIILIVACTPRSVHLMIFWMLFQNALSLHRFKAMLMGLLNIGSVNEWVVTEKSGDALKTKLNGEAPMKPQTRIRERVNLMEFGVGAYLLLCGCYDVAFRRTGLYVYLFLQSIAYFAVGIGYVGTFTPSS